MLRIQNYIRSLSPFLGVSPERLIPLFEKVRLEFESYEKDDRILYPGMPADRVTILLNGPVVYEREHIEGVRVSWEVSEGQPLDLPALFSLNRCHDLTARAQDRVNVVAIDRTQFRRLYEAEPIILINLLNILGRAANTPQAITGSNVVEFWLNSLSRIGTDNPVRVEVTLERMSEILSTPVDTLKQNLKECIRKGMISWLPTQNAIVIKHRNI